MTRRQYPLALWALLVAGGIAWTGCSQAQPEVSGPPPPPASAPAKAAQTYDYTHSIRKDARIGLGRKPVIALVRFADDRAVDDIPYGPAPESAPSQVDTNVAVDVQVGGVRPAQVAKEPLGLNRRARDILKHELTETESFVLVERERILDIIREQKFGQTRYVNPDTSLEIGEVMAVQYLLEGSIGPNEDRTLKDTLAPAPSYKDGDSSTFDRVFARGSAGDRQRLQQLAAYRLREARRYRMELQNSVGVYLSLYDVRTGEIAVEAFGIGGNGLEAIRDAVEDLVDKCRDLPNAVCIAAVDGDRVFIDLGVNDRVKVGQRFRYLTPGPVVRNRAGQVLGTQEEEGGEIEITRVDPLMSVAKVVKRVSDPVVGGRVEPLD